MMHDRQEGVLPLLDGSKCGVEKKHLSPWFLQSISEALFSGGSLQMILWSRLLLKLFASSSENSRLMYSPLPAQPPKVTDISSFNSAL